MEFSGACAGCGETPYLKVLSQLVGDRMVVANATGCSSIYGGNLPTTPWAVDADGRGPAWSNSLFEDNAEFGLGMRLGIDARRNLALALMDELEDAIGRNLVLGLEEGCSARSRRRSPDSASGWRSSAPAWARSKVIGLGISKPSPRPSSLPACGSSAATDGPTTSGSGSRSRPGERTGRERLGAGHRGVLQHRGQASKATPRGAVAKFAAAGKGGKKKDLGMIATAYGDVYVGQIAMGADMPHTVKVIAEAEAYPGPRW